MTPNEFKKKLRGIVPVQFCPFTKEGEVDMQGLKENTKFIVDFAKRGKDVVVLTNGSTTEFYVNSMEQQKKNIETVIDTVSGQIPVIVGVSQPAAEPTIRMAKYAEEVGADCAMVVSPFYHHASQEGMYQYYKTVAESVNIGIIVYNNIDVSGTMIPPELMARLSKIDNIVAVKDNSPIVGDYFWKSILVEPNDLVLIVGLGEVEYLGAAVYGLKYRGFVNLTGNFAPDFPYAIYEAVEAGNFNKAYEALKKELPLFRAMAKIQSRRTSISVFPEWLRAPTTFTTVGKLAMDLVGLRGGPYHQGQLPIEDLTAEEKQEVKQALKEMGVI